MNQPAAIAASLVGIKNVATHKSVALTIHVPQERAMEVINAFGWPTMVNPIDVAVARLQPVKADTPNREAEVGGVSPALHTSAAKPKREMTLASRIAIICGDDRFKKFLSERYNLSFEQQLENTPADIVRQVCKVSSRSEIKYDTPEADRWNNLYNSYEQWLSEQS